MAEFRIADTFTGSLARLTADEQKAVKITVFDLQANPASPGLSFHKLDKAKDKNFWSVRVNADIRIIVHRTAGSLLLCYVDHHDKAYAWAERRKLETHPTTGAAQIVEVRETVREIPVPVYVNAPAAPKKLLFAGVPENELLAYGVPPEWLIDVRQANEDTLFQLVDHLPSEAAEALLELATGGKPKRRVAAPEVPAARVELVTGPVDLDLIPVTPTSPFDHPDAQRRFRVVSDIEELRLALEFPWDKWTVFLHPDQRELVERDYSGPARVSGSAGTGKTIVALHRAVHLARTHREARVLLTTFSDALANALRTRLRRLIGGEPRLGERLEVHAVPSIGERLYRSLVGPVTLAKPDEIAALLRDAAAAAGGYKFRQRFLVAEWEQIVDAWQLDTWESYRDVVRLGRKTRLPEEQRRVLWGVFEKVRSALAAQKKLTPSGMFNVLAAAVVKAKHVPFDFAVVDEAQDISVSQLRFLAALGRNRPNALFFAGDLGQRIFQQPFSWLALGADVRGRSRTLRVNYRTSHQIRMQADRLLGPVVSDADGNVEERKGTISAFNGPAPDVRTFKTENEEIAAVRDWIAGRMKEGLAPHEFGVFVRSPAELDRARTAVEKAGLPYKVLDERVETTSGFASVSTMHLAKGLEFRVVAVIACDDEVIPLQERISAVGDDADLQEVYDTERHLLYVACTRARDQLLVTATEPASEFLDDLRT